MKKTVLALAMIGLFAVSCGQKDSKKVEEETVVENTENTLTEEEAVSAETLKHKIVWTAFKTPEKAGVNGSFDKVALSGLNEEAATLVESLEGAQFEVDVLTVNTDDPARDKTLTDFFFAKLNGNISGSFDAFEDGKVKVTLQMNGVTKQKEFTYEATDTSVRIKGEIDILEDFTAQEAFDSIHKMCKALHEGKTWTDVLLDVTIEE